MENEESTSKLISYWLRHNPSDANLIANEFGWVSLSGIIDSLQARGQKFTIEDLVKLNSTFDKVRWEINFAEDKIRATHGHSYPVLLHEKKEVPPETLYHGTSITNLDSIIKEGLKSMQREFVHLSENIENAKEVGKRHGKPIVLEVNAELFHERGGIFYKTSNNVWLTKALPPFYLSINGWHPVYEEDVLRLKEELIKEISYGHILRNRLVDLKLIMRRYDCDDCLFVDQTDNKLFVVHLTWSKETNALYPRTWQYETMIDCLNDAS